MGGSGLQLPWESTRSVARPLYEAPPRVSSALLTHSQARELPMGARKGLRCWRPGGAQPGWCGAKSRRRRCILMNHYCREAFVLLYPVHNKRIN